MTPQSPNKKHFSGTEDLLRHLDEHPSLEHSELLEDLSPVLAYIDQHIDEYASREMRFSDLPRYQEGLQYLTYKSVGFGASLPGRSAAPFHVYNTESNSFIGIYSLRDNATERVNEAPELEFETLTAANNREPAYVHKLLNANVSPLRGLGKNFRYIWDNQQEFITGAISATDFPALDINSKIIMSYAVMYGVLWEFEDPTLYGVFSAEELVDLYHGEDNAVEVVNESERDLYSQKLSFADRRRYN